MGANNAWILPSSKRQASEQILDNNVKESSKVLKGKESNHAFLESQ